MSRSDQGKALSVAGLAFSGAALGTSFGPAGMSTGAGIAAACGCVIALIGFVYSRRTEDADDKARRADAEAKEKRESERFLNELIKCENRYCQATVQKCMVLRKDMWRMPSDSGSSVSGFAVCEDCFKRVMKRDPIEGSDKRAFT